MKRLFFSFYLFIVLCLVGLGWLVETLWYRSHPDAVQLTVSQQALVEVLSLQLQQYKHPALLAKQLSLQLAIPVQVIPFDEIALPLSSRQKLNRGQSLLLFDQQEQVVIYQQLQPLSSNNHPQKPVQLLRLGPINQQTAVKHTPLALYLLFYLCLALSIALWLRPLWRDLRRVQRQCDYIGRRRSEQNDGELAKIAKHSGIYPIAQTIKQMSERIQALLQMQKEMSDAVSHELRTPLARTKFALAMLPKESDGEAQSIAEDINEMEEIIEQLLDFARLEAGEPNLHLESVDLVQLLSNQLEKIQQGSEHQFRFHHKTDHFQLYQGDGFYLERIVSNLLSNANRYANSQVKVSLKDNNNEYIICIEDDGPGIPEDKLAAIFSPFYRLDKSRGKATGGVGLGLAIVRRLVRWHDGRCYAEKSKLGGACFIIHLPKILQAS